MSTITLDYFVATQIIIKGKDISNTNESLNNDDINLQENKNNVN